MQSTLSCALSSCCLVLGFSWLYALQVGRNAPRNLETDLLDPYLAGLDLSPDGRHLLFVSNRK